MSILLSAPMSIAEGSKSITTPWQRQNRPGRCLELPSGILKVDSEAGHRRAQVQNPGLQGLGAGVGQSHSAVRHHITPLRDLALCYSGTLGARLVRTWGALCVFSVYLECI